MSTSTHTGPKQATPLDAKNMKIGVVTARFNFDVTTKLQEGALSALKEMHADSKNIRSVSVPGAFEVPLAAQALLESGCDAVIALGAVIRGETSHYDYVCTSVERGCTELQLKTGKPVGFGILTTESEEQAFDRAGGRHGNKGAEVAQVVVEMVQLLRNIKG
jgi:6,7-dimethyl-8-ribityllumazine synthase